MFTDLVLLTLVVILGAWWYTASIIRDSLHPLMFFCPLSAFLYVWMPARLIRDQTLAVYFSSVDLESVQILCLLGIASLIAGCVSGTGHPATRATITPRTPV